MWYLQYRSGRLAGGNVEWLRPNIGKDPPKIDHQPGNTQLLCGLNRTSRPRLTTNPTTVWIKSTTRPGLTTNPTSVRIKSDRPRLTTNLTSVRIKSDHPPKIDQPEAHVRRIISIRCHDRSFPPV